METSAAELDKMMESSTFDPVNLLQAGLSDLKDRTLSIQCLKRSPTVSSGVPRITRNHSSSQVLPNPISSNETALKETYSKPLQITSSSSASVLNILPSQEHEKNSSTVNIIPVIPEDYYSSLAVAPHASLIHIVMLYHQSMCRYGLSDEASKIANLLQGLKESDGMEITSLDLRGIDLLLKDGLLAFYLRIQPYLPPVPSQIVKFKSLSYTTDIHVTNAAYETILTKFIQCVQGPLGKKEQPEKVKLLKDVSGYLMPGTLTLVLGPHGCGKGSLHRLLSGHTTTPEGLITYNDEHIRNIAVHDLAAMVERFDNHLPLLTVRETIEFARKCLLTFQPKNYGPELLEIMGDALKIGQDPKVEIILSMLGLKHVADRFVGSSSNPSIAEDERRRLTAAEMFTGVHAVYFLDELNTAAEDSVSYDLLTAIRIFTRVRQITFMASLFQPTCEVFDLFDRLILLNQGHIVYQGPRQDALPYFESIGYKKPKHVSIGEFLQEVTTTDGAAYLRPGFKRMEIEDFVDAYKSSNMYRDICRVLDSPELVQELWVQGSHQFKLDLVKNQDLIGPKNIVSIVPDKDGSPANISMDQTTGVHLNDKVVAFGGIGEQLQYIDTLDSSNLLNENLLNTLEQPIQPARLQLERKFTKVHSSFGKRHGDYVLGWKSEILLLTKRELKVTCRNMFGLYARVFQVLILSLFIGFLLFRVKNDADQTNMNLFRTAFFVSILNMTNINLGLLPTLMEERNLYYKQTTAHFFRPMSYLLGKILGSVPFSLCEATIWTFIVYFLTGLNITNGGWHFFVYYLVIILTVLNGASMVRFFSFFAPSKEKAGMFTGLLVAIFVLFAGFLLPRFKVPKYWLWVYYINPFQWAITALVINEYNSSSYGQLCKDVPDLNKIPQCAGRPNDTVGHAFLARGQFYTSNHWIAVSVAVMIGWILLWNIFSYFAMLKLQHGKIIKKVQPAESKGKVNVEIKLQDIESSVMELSHTAIPITLSWHELNYDIMVPSFRTPRSILSYVSGWGEPNDMVAFLGNHGAGKTTLLNCLSGRKILKERIGGQILVNGYPKVQSDFSHIMGYVDKIDAYSPYMTVKETLIYSTTMRLGKFSSQQNKLKFVEEALELTGMKNLEDTLVISLVNDVSFHQEKRLAIATELVANPSVLFLDDPLKSLDSINAVQITTCLQRIAKTGRLVIAILEHPSQRILSMFTKVQILKSGETVYFGPVGSNCDIVRMYFEAIPGTSPCPSDKSVSTYVLDMIGESRTYRRSIKDYAFEYRVSELALQNHIHLQHLRRSKGQNISELHAQNYAAPFITMLSQTILTIQRQYWRNINYSWARFMSYLVMSLLLGSVFYKIDVHNNAGMNSRAGAIFISCVLVGITNAQNAIPLVVQMRGVLRRERSVHQARVSMYNIAFSLAEIPYLMVATFIFCCIFLPMTGIAVESAAHFFQYWFISSEFFVVITFFAILLAIIAPVPQIASVLVPVIVGIWVATAGLVVPKRKLLSQFIWIYWTNPLQFALDGLTSVAFFCDLDKPSCLNAGRNPACASNPSVCPTCDCPRLSDSPTSTFVWSQISYNRSLHYSRVPYDMLALFLSAVIIRFLTFMALKYMKHYKRT